MKDLLLPLREAYYSKLTALGLLVFEEGAVPVPSPFPYVILSTQTANEDSNKSDFGHKATMLLDIVTRVPKNKTGGSKGADTIAGLIFTVINSKTVFTINADFQSVLISLVEDRKLNSETDTSRIYRRLLRFEHTVRQLN